MTAQSVKVTVWTRSGHVLDGVFAPGEETALREELNTHFGQPESAAVLELPQSRPDDGPIRVLAASIEAYIISASRTGTIY